MAFHGGRGPIVDPIYIASMFEDLLGWLPVLKPAAVMDTVNTHGGIHAIAQLSNTTFATRGRSTRGDLLASRR
jgi:hypothetical protein